MTSPIIPSSLSIGSRRNVAREERTEARSITDPACAAEHRSHVWKGRGATFNPAIRFETERTEPFDDGWPEPDDAETSAPKTTLIRDVSRSALSWNESPDIGFDRAVNPYRGCEHGCIYCYARPSHAYLGFSPGLDFETKILFKPDIAQLLEHEIAKRGYVVRPITLGSNTDVYQPIERKLGLMRAILETLERASHPLTIVTKSAGVLRDIDILSRLASRHLARVHISLTTLDAELARRMEPRAASPARRLHAIAELARAHVPVGIMAAPMIPGLNDPELEHILEAAAKAGASRASFTLVRLSHELKGLFADWLGEHYPDRAQHVLHLIRETRGGRLNDSRFHARMRGTGTYATLLASRFKRAAHEFGLDRPFPPLDCTQFVAPSLASNAQQLSLF